MTEPSPLTRRAVVALGGATVMGASALALAACTPTGSSSGDSGSSQTGSSGSGSGESGAAGSSASPPTPSLVKLSSIPVGGSTSSTLGGQPIVLAQPKEGTVVAFSAICTHQGCVIAPAGLRYDCPCHGSIFNAVTGDVIRGPAVRPLTKLTTSVSGDSVTVSA
jgi:Rieske Fe-S protein